MWQLGGYLESSPVVGVVRFSLQQPTKDNCDPSLEGCINAFVPLNELEYCAQAAATATSTSNKSQQKTYKGAIYPCEIYEAINAQIVTETSLVILTRASTRNQSMVCDGTVANTCPRTYSNANYYSNNQTAEPFYIAQSEAFTVLVEHSVTASKICSSRRNHHQGYACSAEASQYQGRLYSAHAGLCRDENQKENAFASYRGDHLVDTAPCYIGPNRTTLGQDFFSLDVLLKAAGVSSLDDCNTKGSTTNQTSSISNSSGDDGAPAAASTCKTYRDAGATLLLNIVWNDFRPYHGIVEPYYYYAPQLVGGTSYKLSIPFYEHYRSSRVLLVAHGIKIAVLLGGEFHQFKFLQFLITLTTALGLLAVATTVVDSLMLYVLPEKERYQQVKYEEMALDPITIPHGQQQQQQLPTTIGPFLQGIVDRNLTNTITTSLQRSNMQRSGDSSSLELFVTEDGQAGGGLAASEEDHIATATDTWRESSRQGETLNEPLLQQRSADGG
jgi:hypothetical protein